MRAAIDELAATAGGRRVAVLGDMLELGREAPRMHREIGEHASARGVDVLVGVGELAAQSAAAFAAARQRTAQSAAGEIHTTADAREAAGVLAALVRDGDTVLVKGSRGVGLELVAQRLREERAPLGADAAAVAGARAGAPALSAGAERR
ncbi:MAG TPA: hypothetical protein VKV16_10095, partial [Solirubrobacteraceae bacterium]|nr:hypothetical protein [Solirubrobacteraceae bacterium]